MIRQSPLHRLRPALLAAVGALGLTAPAYAQYSGGGSTQMPTTDTMDPTTLYRQAVGFVQAKDFVRAVPLLRDVLAMREQDPASNLMMGVAQIGLGDLREARRFLVRAVSEKPDLAEALGRLGWIEARLGAREEAASLRQRLVSLKDACAAGCAEEGAIAGAISLIDSAAGAATMSASARFNQGVDALGARSWQEAIIAFNDVLAAKPDDHEAAFMKGQAQAASGDLSGAKISLETALRIKPDLAAARGRLGWVEARLGDTDAAAGHRAELTRQGAGAPQAEITAAIALIDRALAAAR